MSAGLDRRAAVRLLLAGRGDALVISGLGSASYDVFAAGDDDRNFYLWGAMGGAAMVAYGLARAQPSRRVVAITGDGEQLMGAGALIAIAAQPAANLAVIVLDNGRYGETGMQASHTGLGVDLCAIARAAGFPRALEARDEASLAALCEALHAPGLLFGVVRISDEPVERALPPRDGVFLKNRLRAALGLAPN